MVGESVGTRRTRWGANLLVGVSVVGVFGSGVLSSRTGWRTDNVSLRSPLDAALLSMILAVPLVGYLQARRQPRHLPGWIMLWAGAWFGLGLLCHELALYCLLTANRFTLLGHVSAWCATWMIALGVGLMPFVLAGWPTGRLEQRWLRALRRLAAGALAVVVVIEAFSSDVLDGVAPGAGVIENPAGVDWLSTVNGPLNAISVITMLAFAVSAVVDVVRRYVRGSREARRDLRGPVILLAGIAVVALLGAAIGSVAGARSADAAVTMAQVAAIVGLVAISVVAIRLGRRSDRAERDRRALVQLLENERLLVRHELHDGIGPILAALGLNLDVALAGLTANEQPAINSIVKSKVLLREALVEVRRVAGNLRPPTLDELGFADAVRQQVTRLTSSPDAGSPEVEVAVTLPAQLPGLPAAHEVALYRITGEAVTNVVHHARAQHCSVSLVLDSEAVILEIADDGCGMPSSSASGVGLASMRRRAEELGGSFTTQDRRPHGTSVHVTLPLPT